MRVGDMNQNERDNMEDLCASIPRCLGYIPTLGLVSTQAKRKQGELQTLSAVGFNNTFYYIEKETRHKIFFLIWENLGVTIALWGLVTIWAFVLVLLPQVFTWIQTKLRRLFRKG